MSQTEIRPTGKPASKPTGKPASKSNCRSTTRPALPRARYPRGAAAPVLVEVRRGSIVESRHRGHIVQVNAKGAVEWGIGDPDVVVSLRSAVKPFGVAALVEAGGIDEFNLTEPELAVMAASHTGEDAHVRTLQGVLRRAGLSQNMLACGTDGAPLDKLTAARLARDGETPGPLRHMCSGFHASSLLLSRLEGWDLTDYWRPEHDSQVAVRDMVARIFKVKPHALVSAVDACGVPTYAFPLASVARAFALLADPAADSPLLPVRDAMVAAPDMVGGTRDSTDSKLMRALPRGMVVKAGAEGLRGVGMLAGARGAESGAGGLAIKIEDGNLFGRASQAATVEALAQLGVLDEAAVERLRDLHRPLMRDPRGDVVGESVAVFTLAPLSELS